MGYRRTVIALASTILVLAAILFASMLSDGSSVFRGPARFSWLSAEAAERAARIELRTPSLAVVLVRSADRWYLERGGIRYPAKQSRVADLLAALVLRASYLRRDGSREAYERLSLLESSASRITVYGDPAAPPLLALLIGAADASGLELHLRRQGEAAVYSGRDGFSPFLSGADASWLDLRLFPREGAEALRPESVQRVLVRAEDGSYTLARTGAAAWLLDGSARASSRNADALLRALADLEGEEILDPEAAAAFQESASVVLELGDGRNRIVALGPEDQTGRRAARVGGVSPTFLLAPWAVERLLRPRAYFSDP